MPLLKAFPVFAVAIVSACAVVPATQASAPPAPPVVSSGGVFSATESRIFDLINAERVRRGIPALVYNPKLDQMAKIQAGQMATFQKMAHVLPGAELPTVVDRAHRVGYAYGHIAENVALGYPSAEAVVEGWMTSKGHRENILDRDVVETGIGMARSSAGGLYYCQVFGRRLTGI